MNPSFDQLEFITLIEALATTEGASLNEGPRRDRLKKYLNLHCIESETDSAGNLWCHLSGGHWDDTVIYDAHIDVVQKGCISSVTYDGDRMTGMGVGDNLTAVVLLAMLGKAVNSGDVILTRPLKLLFSVGEEGDGNLKGVRQVVRDHITPPRLFMSFDLSFEEYSVAALGSKRYAINVSCPGGHSWDDYGTPGAIEQLIGFFNDLKSAFDPVFARSPGQISFNTGMIGGGEGINSISGKANAAFEFRSVNEQLLEKMDLLIFEIIGAMNLNNDVCVECVLTGERPAAQSVASERIEPIVKRILSDVCVNPKSVPRSTNINIPLVFGWPSICMGLCRGGRFHSEEEYVEMGSLKDGWEVLLALTNELAG